MSDRDDTQLPSEPDNPYTLALTVTARAIAAILLVMGLRHWVYIAGVFSEPGWNLSSMSSAWRFVTVQLAVVDLVAAVGLWMRVSWGNVLWLYAAIFEVAIHTAFAHRFGLDLPVLGFHLIAIGGTAVLMFLERRHQAKPAAGPTIASS